MSQIKVGDFVKFKDPLGGPDYVTKEYGLVIDVYNHNSYAWVRFTNYAGYFSSPLSNLIKKEDDVKILDKLGAYVGGLTDMPLPSSKSQKAQDNVNSPAHYNAGTIECITYLEDTLGDGISYYLEGNIKKYLHRWRYKNGVEDLKKAKWYLERLILSQKGE